MNPTLNPFEELLVLLVKAQIEFITVGGIACAFNGYARATEDVDILIKKQTQNIQSLVEFLSNYGQGYGKELTLEDFSDEEGAIRVIEEFPIDIFVVMGGNTFDDLKKYTETMELDGEPIPYLNKEGLILLKSESVRPKDKMDVVQLQMLKK